MLFDAISLISNEGIVSAAKFTRPTMKLPLLSGAAAPQPRKMSGSAEVADVELDGDWILGFVPWRLL